jgi:hypothetical protein
MVSLRKKEERSKVCPARVVNRSVSHQLVTPAYQSGDRIYAIRHSVLSTQPGTRVRNSTAVVRLHVRRSGTP